MKNSYSFQAFDVFKFQDDLVFYQMLDGLLTKVQKDILSQLLTQTHGVMLKY